VVARVLATAILCACSGEGAGADACRTLEHARCDRQAACSDWSGDDRDECKLERDAACRAGAAERVRGASDDAVDACAAALREADCDALSDPFSIAGCEPFAADAGSS
jgi:hypothetical protein